MTSSLVLSDFWGVAATLNLAVTERVGATFRKNIFLFSGVAEEPSGYYYSRGIFSFRGLTKKEISVIMELRRKVWG